MGNTTKGGRKKEGKTPKKKGLCLFTKKKTAPQSNKAGMPRLSAAGLGPGGGQAKGQKIRHRQYGKWGACNPLFQAWVLDDSEKNLAAERGRVAV